MKRLFLGLICLLCLTCPSTVSHAQEIPALIEQLNDKDATVRHNASLHLARSGKPAVIALADALAQASPLHRIRIVQTLQRIGLQASPAIPALILALRQHKEFLADALPRVLSYHWPQFFVNCHYQWFCNR